MLDKDFYTAKEAADILGVSKMTIQNWCKSGQLSSYRVGNVYRIPMPAVEVYRRGRPAARPTIDVGKTFEVELASLVQAWLWDMENGPKPRSPETIRTHRMHLHKYVRTLLGPDVPPDARLTFQEALTEHAMLRVLGRIPVAQFATRYNVFMAVMSLCNFLVRQGVLPPTAKEALKAHKPHRLLPPKRTALHSEADINRYIQTVWLGEGYSLYEKTLNTAIIGMMAFAGLRVSEVARLQLSEVDLANRLIHINNGKGGKKRLVGLNARLKGMVENYLKLRPGSDCTRLFVAAKGTGLQRDYLVRRLRRIQISSGMDVSAHGLRRTFATLNANAGRSINLIQLALGHADLSTTQQYLMADQQTAVKHKRPAVPNRW